VIDYLKIQNRVRISVNARIPAASILQVCIPPEVVDNRRIAAARQEVGVEAGNHLVVSVLEVDNLDIVAEKAAAAAGVHHSDSAAGVVARNTDHNYLEVREVPKAEAEGGSLLE